MPVTPRFRLSQDASFVVVDIHVPYVRTRDMEFTIDGRDFLFSCPPYLLRLGLPGDVVDDDRTKATYDPARVRGTGPRKRTASLA